MFFSFVEGVLLFVIMSKPVIVVDRSPLFPRRERCLPVLDVSDIVDVDEEMVPPSPVSEVSLPPGGQGANDVIIDLTGFDDSDWYIDGRNGYPIRYKRSDGSWVYRNRAGEEVLDLSFRLGADYYPVVMGDGKVVYVEF